MKSYSESVNFAVSKSVRRGLKEMGVCENKALDHADITIYIKLVCNRYMIG